MRTKRNGAETGFTLVELMVAVLLMLIVMAGFLPVFLQGLSQSSAARYKSMATNIAREKIEQIRQLDYREITTDPSKPRNLAALFGDEVVVPERNMTYTITYLVENAMPGQSIKSVQVTVTWNAPPRPSPAVVKTLIAQQYLGPRGARLVVDDITPDTPLPGGTPFPLLPNKETPVKYYLAQADWFMAYDSLSLPLAPPNDISLTSVFQDSTGATVGTISVDKNGLNSTTGGTPGVTDIWFQYSIDARTIPDGYWDLLVTMLNVYKEPGNTWDLRVRVENGPPLKPANFVATGTTDTQIELSWLPGPERDRERYVLQRMKRNPDGTTWPAAWTMVDENLPPNTAEYTDIGVIGTADEPWGLPLPAAPNCYRYRIYGVDTGERSAPDSAAVSGDVTLPPLTSISKVPVPSVINLSFSDAKNALISAALEWSVTAETPVATPVPGTVLTQSPVAQTEVAVGTTVYLTVAAPASPPPVYAITIKKTANNTETIVILDANGLSKYSGLISRDSPVIRNLSDGNYTIHKDTATGRQLGDFPVSGAAITVTI